MKHSTLHVVIIITALITAIIHLVVLSVLLGQLSPLFMLNGLGFLLLLGAWNFTPGFLSEHRTALNAVFILYTLVTIGAWLWRSGTKVIHWVFSPRSTKSSSWSHL